MNNYIFPAIYFLKIVFNLVLYSQFQQLSTSPSAFKDFSQTIKALVVINFILLLVSIYFHYQFMNRQETNHFIILSGALVAEIAFTLSYFAISVQPEKYTNALDKLRGLTFTNVAIQVFILTFGAWLIYRDLQLNKRSSMYIPTEFDSVFDYNAIKKRNLDLINKERPSRPTRPTRELLQKILQREEDIYGKHNTPIYISDEE